jgi:hypothetical protein
MHLKDMRPKLPERWKLCDLRSRTARDDPRQRGVDAGRQYPGPDPHGERIIAYITHTITLQHGDVIATETPGGVGAGRKPPVFLGDGDEVVVTVERLTPCAIPSSSACERRWHLTMDVSCHTVPTRRGDQGHCGADTPLQMVHDVFGHITQMQGSTTVSVCTP